MNQDILIEILKPKDPPWDYFLYVVIVLQVILLGIIFAGTLRDVIFIGITVMCAVADKAYLFGFIEGGYKVTLANLDRAVEFHTTESFMTYAARVAMFALPLIIITQTKIPRAKPAAVFTAVTTAVYVFTRWFFEQYPEGWKDFRQPGTYIYVQGVFVGQAAIMYLMLGRIKMRDYFVQDLPDGTSEPIPVYYNEQ